MAKTTGTDSLQTFVQFLAQLWSTGSVRHKVHPKTGAEMNHVFEFTGTLDMNASTARSAWIEFLHANPESVQKVDKLKFDPRPGQSQNHKTWGADAETLYHFALSLSKEYSRPFIEFAAKCSTLALGGSVAVQQAIGEMRQVQQALPDDNPLRVFGRAAEQADERVAKRAKLMKDYELYKTRNEATEATKEATATMIDRFGADTGDIVRKNITVTKGACGFTPSELKRKLGEDNPRVSARSLLSQGALAAAVMWESAFAELANEHENVDNALRNLETMVNSFQPTAALLGKAVLRNSQKVTPDDARQGLVSAQRDLQALAAQPTAPALPPTINQKIKQCTINNYFAPTK